MTITKNILIGVTGSVAAIKIPEIVENLHKLANSNSNFVKIKIVRTSVAKECFFDSESCEKFEVFDDTPPVKYKRSDPILHIELRRWADIYLICPLDANTLAKLSTGLCDNLLTDTARAWDFTKPFWVYPCMNTYMFEHKLTEENLKKLESFGIKVVPPVSKELACGDFGIGALKDPQDIAEEMGGNTSKLDDELSENKRKVNRTIRELERQRLATERQEESIVAKLKAEARSGRMKNARLMAKDVLRNRRMANHFYNMKSQMMALQSQLQAAHSTNIISNNFKSVSDLMTQVNCKTNVAEFQKIMENISQQGEMLNLKLDMMGEAMDDTMMDGMDEERAVNELMEELGVDVSSTLNTLKCPKTAVSDTSNMKAEEASGTNSSGRAEEILEVEERINNLKK